MPRSDTNTTKKTGTPVAKVKGGKAANSVKPPAKPADQKEAGKPTKGRPAKASKATVDPATVPSTSPSQPQSRIGRPPRDPSVARSKSPVGKYVPPRTLPPDTPPELAIRVRTHELARTVDMIAGVGVRFEILAILAKQGRTVGELAGLANQRQPAISHHLKLLRASGLVIDTPDAGDGRSKVCSLNKGKVVECLTAVAAVLGLGD